MATWAVAWLVTRRKDLSESVIGLYLFMACAVDLMIMTVLFMRAFP